MAQKRTSYIVSFLVALTILLLVSRVGFSQSQSVTADQDTSFTNLFVLPAVFFTPETGWGFGAAGISTLSLPGSYYSSRPSQLQLVAAYTLKNQLLLYAPFDFYINNNEYNLSGELGYYIYSYPFFGIGNNALQGNEEFYEVRYPRIIISAKKSVLPNVRLGLRYWLDGYDITSVESGGLLDSSSITGSMGGTNSGLAFVATWDQRDNIFYTRSGLFAEYIIHTDQAWLGSDFSFMQTTVDLRKFWTNCLNHTLAIQLFGQFSSSGTPFFRLPLLGGTNRMRGFLEGRFRDRQYITFQSAYRLPVYKRWGAVAFGSVGEVAPTVNAVSLAKIKPAGGLGVRYKLDKEQHLNIRLDLGFSETGTSFYITFAEAF